MRLPSPVVLSRLLRRRHDRRTAGFSLIELSVVVVIISIVVVLGLEATSGLLNRTAYQVTAERLDAIDRAIVEYRKTYGRLPCPATLSTITPSCAGKEARPSKESCINYTVVTPPACGVITKIDVASSTDDMFYGEVPVRDLGLPLSFRLDAYGMKFIYVVGDKLTMAGTSAGEYAHSASIDPIQIRSGKQDVSCGVAGNRCQSLGTAAYAVFSTGRDKRGSLTAANAALLTCMPDTTFDGRIDTINCRLNSTLATTFAVPNNVLYDSRFNAGTQEDSFFDDVIRWRAKSNL